MKKLVLMMVWALPLLCHQEKYICSSHEGAGFFSAFFGALNQLWWCEHNNKIPVMYWDDVSLYYQPDGYHGATNAWEYYFEPVSHEQYCDGDDIHYQYLPPTAYVNFTDFTNTTSNRRLAKLFMDKYIRIKPYILDAVDSFYHRNFFRGKKTIGIYYRGTDKSQETKRIPIAAIIKNARKFKGCQFFVATDEQYVLDMFKKLLPGPVIHTDCFRSKDGRPIHFYGTGGKALAGQEVLIDALLLARCDFFIHTWSNVSMGVLIFNPELQNLCLRKD